MNFFIQFFVLAVTLTSVWDLKIQAPGGYSDISVENVKMLGALQAVSDQVESKMLETEQDNKNNKVVYKVGKVKFAKVLKTSNTFYFVTFALEKQNCARNKTENNKQTCILCKEFLCNGRISDNLKGSIKLDELKCK